ncbi:MAG: hypothetical protein IT462_12315 [Planctomycetes bacterium]|nr:hypothetical protein [Planctomycetota bacterium]
MAWQESIKAIRERGKAAFGKLSIKQRWIAAGVGAAVFALVFCLVFFTAREGGKVPLQSPVKDLTQARIELQKYSIESDYSTDKSDLVVPREKRDRALIILNAAKLLPDGLPNYNFLGQADFTSTEPQRFERIRVQIEDLLRSTIVAMDGIRQASVRITPASREVLFKPGAGRNKAAVTVGLVGQDRLNPQQVVSIANLVSASYPNLAPEDVFIADTSGRPYTVTGDMQSTSDRYELRRRIEADKEQAALKALAGLDAIVAATLEVTLIDERASKTTDYQPDGAEPVVGYRESATEKRTTADPRGTAGIRAEAGNSNRTDAASGAKVGTEDRKEILEKAAVDENFSSELERMKLVIDYGLSSLAISLPEGGDEKAQGALSGKVRNLASRATGIPLERIAVEFTPRIAGDTREDWVRNLIGPGGMLTAYIPMIGSVLLLLVLVGAFLLVFGMLRRGPRAPAATKTTVALATTLETPALNTEANQIFERINGLVKENPAAAANIVRRWMIFNE